METTKNGHIYSENTHTHTNEFTVTHTTEASNVETITTTNTIVYLTLTIGYER